MANQVPTLIDILNKDELDQFKILSPQSQITFLRELSAKANGGVSEWLESIVQDLKTKFQSQAPLESLSISPKEYDVLLNDIDEEDLLRISEELGHGRLAPLSRATSSYPLRGILFGKNLRAFIPLPVSKRDKLVNVVFLYDTGSPFTYLRVDTMEALGFVDLVPSSTNVSINGVELTVNLSCGHFTNVDLIGQDFFRCCSLEVTISYKRLSIQVSPA